MLGRLVLTVGAAVAVFLSASLAHAQYKNSAFGLDVGGWLITKPTILDDDGNVLPKDKRPLRLGRSLRIGGEADFKMDADHWWFITRVNVAFMEYTGTDSPAAGDKQAQYDAAAREALGTIFGIQGAMQVRYYILTDRFRPYLSFGLSYLRLFSFADLAEDQCVDTALECTGDNAGTNEDNYLPHPNVGAVHLEPGAEIILTRDIFLHIFVDLQRWLVFNAADNNAVVLGLGITLYS